jgi:hypothetical protein
MSSKLEESGVYRVVQSCAWVAALMSCTLTSAPRVL